tara:strand:- start:1276 stop:1767 length:492 start_codon:yes stop_codon:yes gene_type:complete
MIHKLFTKNNGLYKIRKNMNFSGFWFFKVFFKTQKPFQVGVIMDKSCEVQTLGVQKIFGIGDLFHHKNSDRYGFIYEGNHKFGIYSYQYRDGKLIPWEKLGTVKTEEPFFIVFDDNSKYKIGRYLYPYFEQDGDDEKGAPHDMKIRLYFTPVDKSVHAQVFNM